ncbi:hypothetical protein [Cytobacillus praedii]|uniref:hypothetical protein n=1 Tax=Cytobacillus praedii TaxID=1742358 RepID=UPI002E203E4E|nr:hypothetical protein [Cytobacillus praedii]
MEKKKKPTLKDRLTNPAYLAAVSGFAYNAYQVVAKKNGLPEVDLGSWQVAVDLISFGAIGVGIHATFTKE